MEYNKNFMEALQQCAFDSVLECQECGNLLEPDAKKCGECGWENPVRAMGMI